MMATWGVVVTAPVTPAGCGTDAGVGAHARSKKRIKVANWLCFILIPSGRGKFIRADVVRFPRRTQDAGESKPILHLLPTLGTAHDHRAYTDADSRH